MEGRVILKNQQMIAVRLNNGSYSVLRMTSGVTDIEIGDIFTGILNKAGAQRLHHLSSNSFIEVHVELAETQIAAKTKQLVDAHIPC